MNPLTYITSLFLTLVLAAFLNVISFWLATAVFWPLVIIFTALLFFDKKPKRVVENVIRIEGPDIWI